MDCAERRAHATTPTHKQQRAESRREGASEAQREVEAAFKSRRLEPSPMGSQTQSLHKCTARAIRTAPIEGWNLNRRVEEGQHAPHTPNPKDAQQPGGGKRARRQHKAGEAGRSCLQCSGYSGWIGNWRITTDASAMEMVVVGSVARSRWPDLGGSIIICRRERMLVSEIRLSD